MKKFLTLFSFLLSSIIFTACGDKMDDSSGSYYEKHDYGKHDDLKDDVSDVGEDVKDAVDDVEKFGEDVITEISSEIDRIGDDTTTETTK